MVIILSIQQIVLISQNITVQEFNAAVRERGTTVAQKQSWWKSFYISNNMYNRGIKANWLTFIRQTRNEPPVSPLDATG